MSTASKSEIYFSFFMFTVDLMPEDTEYSKILVKHLQTIAEMGYDGFDLHIAPRSAKVPHKDEVASYNRLKQAFDDAGLKNAKFATNVGTTSFFDPTSPYKEQREGALAYLKSRVEITSVLGGEGAIMSGPFIYPYGAFPLTDLGEPMWSDALQDWMPQRYRAALPILEEVAEYAQKLNVQLAIEPVKNWETPPPNMVSEVLDFIAPISAPCGVTFDTAQILMESQGPDVFRQNVARALEGESLTYVHISAPDRGEVRDSWIPWDLMLGEIAPVYKGPYLIEVFNAIPPLDSGMRMTRRRFWRPGEDPAEPGRDSAYDVARTSLATLKAQLARF